MADAMRNLPKFDSDSLANSKFYRGGFEPKMSKREAALILGVSPSASKTKIKDAHKKIMLLNHPDRGGSPYVAAKINEAKDLMDSTNKLN
jgi:DnaJ family protein C protein 19